MDVLKRLLVAAGLKSVTLAAPPGTTGVRPNYGSGGPRPWWLAYALPLLSTGATILVLEAAGPEVPAKAPIIVFFFPIILSAYVGGLVPGLLSTALCTLASICFILPPVRSWGVWSPIDDVKWITLCGAGTLLSFLMARKEHQESKQLAKQAGGLLHTAERRVQAGFAALLACLVAVTAVSYPTLTRLREDNAWVAHTHRVIDTLRLLVGGATGAESGERGYLITGSAEYLEAYKSAVQNVNQALDDLRRLTSDNPDQQRRIADLKPLVEERLAVLGRANELRSQSFAVARDFVLSTRGGKLKDRIRGIVAEMEATEQALLITREAAARRATRFAKIEILGGSALAILIVGAALLMIGQAFEASRSAEAALQESRDQLEIRVQARTSDLSAANELLRSSEERLRLATQAARIGTFEWDFSTGVNVWSPELEAMHGLARGEFSKTRPAWEQLVHPEDRAAAVGLVNRALETGETVEGEWRIVRPDGSVHWILGRFRAFRNEASGPLALTGVNIDITERKRAEEALRERENFIAGILGSVTEGFIVLDRDWRYRFANEEYWRRIGKSQPELLGQNIWELFPHMVGTEAHLQLHHAMADRVTAEYEFYSPRRRGWFSSRAYPTTDGGLAIFSRDITDRRRAEIELRAREQRLRLAADAAQLGIFEWTVEADTAVWENQRMYEIFGIPDTTDPLNRDRFVRESLHPEDLPRFEQELQESMQPGALFRGAYRIRRANDGQWRWIQYFSKFELAADGKSLRLAGVLQDITDRKRAEEALEEKARLLDLSYDAILVRDKEDRISYWNNGAVEAYGYPPDEALGRSSHELLCTVFPQPLSAIFDTLRREGHWNGELVHTRKDGSKIMASSRWAVDRNPQGDIEAILETNSDITERKRAEEALRQSLERLERVLEVETVGVMFWDLSTGVMVDANDAFLKLMGYSRSQVEARELTWQKLTPPEYMDVSRAEVEKFLATGRVGPYEKEYFQKDGTKRWLLFAGSSLGNNQCVEFCVDISERKRMEEALRESEAQFRTLANAIPQLCWIANADGWIYWYNDRWYQYTGTTAEEMEGWGWQSVHDPEALPGVLERWKGSIATGEPFDMVFPLRGADGVFRPFLTRVVPVRDEEGRVARWFGTNTDISEQRRIEAELRENEAVLRSFFDSPGMMRGIVELVGGQIAHISCNEAAAQMYGINQDSIAGKTATESGASDELTRLWAALFEEARRTGKPVSHEYSRVDAQGRLRWHLTDVSYLGVGRSGNSRFAYSTVDLSDRKQAEELLRESEHRLSGIISSAMDSVISVDECGKIILFNPAAERVFACTPAEAIGQPLDKFIPERFRASHAGHVRSFGHSAKVHKPMSERGEISGLRADGAEFPIEASISQAQVGQQKVFTVILRDISERKRAEEALAFIGSVVESSQDAIIGKSLTGTIQSWNRGAEKLYGYTAAEMIGQSVALLSPPERQEEILAWLEQIREGRSIEHQETVRLHKDGRRIDVSVSISPVKDAQGRLIGASTIARDITERKRAEAALAAKAKELARSNADLEQFAYVASHDLKEPLRAVSGCVGLLQRHCDGKLDNRANEYIAHAVDGAARMESLIDGLLAFSRVGTRGEKFANVECSKALETALKNLASAVRESGAEVTCDPLPAVRGDAVQLASLFQNLIGNALKFRGTAPPRVHVGAHQDGAHWRLSVRDNGIGIDPRHFERIFGVFQRLHTRREYPGTGIGLAVCKKIVERHGGRIWLESQPGEGATFYFSLPPAQV